MTKEEYYRIRNEVYKDAGMDKFDFDLMMMRVVAKAVEEEREVCAKVAEQIERDIFDAVGDPRVLEFKPKIAAAIRARREQ